MISDLERVMRFVESALEEEPEPSTAEIYERAKELDPGVEALNLRQFHARFPLQVRRREALGRSGKRRARRSRNAKTRRILEQERSRVLVRQAFLRFALDLTQAENAAELVRVLANLDDYVHEAVAAVK